MSEIHLFNALCDLDALILFRNAIKMRENTSLEFIDSEYAKYENCALYESNLEYDDSATHYDSDDHFRLVDLLYNADIDSLAFDASEYDIVTFIMKNHDNYENCA